MTGFTVIAAPSAEPTSGANQTCWPVSAGVRGGNVQTCPGFALPVRAGKVRTDTPMEGLARLPPGSVWQDGRGTGAFGRKDFPGVKTVAMRTGRTRVPWMTTR